jgi:hypothetical protein
MTREHGVVVVANLGDAPGTVALPASACGRLAAVASTGAVRVAGGRAELGAASGVVLRAEGG